MDKHNDARLAIQLRKRQAKLIGLNAAIARELLDIEPRLCEVLRRLACHPDAGLDAPTVAAASAPKDEN